MSWNKVKEIVGKSAPVLGTLLGGPAGATVGALVASVLGVDASPAEVERALKVDPQAAIKLKELETLFNRHGSYPYSQLINARRLITPLWGALIDPGFFKHFPKSGTALQLEGAYQQRACVLWIKRPAAFQCRYRRRIPACPPKN